MGIKGMISRAAGKAGNVVARLSALSPDQIDEIRRQREEYLLRMPAPDDIAARETTNKMLAASSIEIYNAYLRQIKELYLPVEKDAEYDRPLDTNRNIRFINITKWVTDKQESSIEKLVNVYAVLADEDCNIALVFHRTKIKTEVYLAVVNTENDSSNAKANEYQARLLDAIRGNFPGAEWGMESSGILPYLKNSKPYSVAAASNIPAEKSEKFVSQTIEKLLDGVVPDSNKKEYTLILLATPIQDIEERKLKLGEFYSGLAPYASWQTDFHLQENKSLGSTATVGVNIGASAGVQNGTNSAITENASETENQSLTDTKNQNQQETHGNSVTDSLSNSHMDGTNSSDAINQSATHMDGTNATKTDTSGSNNSLGVNTFQSFGMNESVCAEAGGGVVPGSVSATIGSNQTFGMGESYQHGWNRSVAEAVGTSTSDTATKGTVQSFGKSAADTVTKGLATMASETIAKTTGSAIANTLGRAVTRGTALTSGASRALNLATNFGANFARASAVTAMIGQSEGITQSFINYNIKHALELLETQMKRLDQSTALGMWDFAAYVLSEDHNTANNVAHSYLALTLGEESYMSKSAINIWRGDVEEEQEAAREICGYLRELRHPVFGLSPALAERDLAYNVYPSIVTATTALSGKELAYSLNFPQKAIAGLPILECASFGRNIATYDMSEMNNEKISLGCFFHMNHAEQENPVQLSLQSLTSHTFITGSTGSGKSNTVHTILKRAKKKGVKFLVIEPAKGEYKNIFGMKKDVFVYGTNPELTPMLRINPFSFPKGIHILEHLDRLIEIFNVCWPMYAAMPAVLKSAVEKSYEDCGWNLNTSRNIYDEEIYPSFADVAEKVREVIDSSEYDSENKGAYKGSLQTRLTSLANGLNGMVFVQDEISLAQLFDENVIIDLSRVGSMETKSLIMGMLVLKLQEYRMVTADAMNAEIRHLTVLEEAHNLLKRTSAEQSPEGSNLVGKSVEMLANAIAEMRTYGEGFIIADQAPGLLDMSVIRNTNTKIIMRLPDLGDRELVGKSAGLNDDQINELFRLPRGVAAVYQNEWIQPILCKVDRCEINENPFRYTISEEDTRRLEETEVVSKMLLDFIMNRRLSGKNKEMDVEELKRRVIQSRLSATVKRKFIAYIKSGKEDAVASLRSLLYDFLEAENAILKSQECTNLSEWVHSVAEQLNLSISDYSRRQIDWIMQMLINEKTVRDPKYGNILSSFNEIYRKEGGVF